MSVRFRIRTSAGQELSFASHEMFEDFVRSGDLSPDDLVYDGDTGSWAPARTLPLVLEIEYEKEEAAEAAAKEEEEESSADDSFGLKLADAKARPEDEADADSASEDADASGSEKVESTATDETSEGPSGEGFGLELAPAEEMMSPEDAAQAFVEKMEAERGRDFDIAGPDKGRMQGFTMEDAGLLSERSAPAPTPAPPAPSPPPPKRKRARRREPEPRREAPAPPQRTKESGGKGRKVVMAGFGVAVLAAGGYFGLQFTRAAPVVDEPDPDTVEAVVAIPVDPEPEPPPPEPVIASTEAAVRERAQERFLTATQNELRDLQPVPEVWPEGEYLTFPSDYGEVLQVWQDYLTTIRRVRAVDEERYTTAYEAALDDAAVAGEDRLTRLNAAIGDFDASLVLRDAHYDRVEALATAAIQSHNALSEAEGLILHDATGATGAPGPVGRGTYGRDADAQLLLDQVLELVTSALEADGVGPRTGANVRAWVWDGFLDAVTN